MWIRKNTRKILKNGRDSYELFVLALFWFGLLGRLKYSNNLTRSFEYLSCFCLAMLFRKNGLKRCSGSLSPSPRPQHNFAIPLKGGVQRDTLRYLENIDAIGIAIPSSAIGGGGFAMLGHKVLWKWIFQLHGHHLHKKIVSCVMMSGLVAPSFQNHYTRGECYFEVFRGLQLQFSGSSNWFPLQLQIAASFSKMQLPYYNSAQGFSRFLRNCSCRN